MYSCVHVAVKDCITLYITTYTYFRMYISYLAMLHKMYLFYSGPTCWRHKVVISFIANVWICTFLDPAHVLVPSLFQS